MKYKLPESLVGYKIFMVGIKGTGMAALAELLTKQGAIVTGSDVPQHFFTDDLLKKANIPYFTEFKADHIDSTIQMVIHSSAYSKDDNPVLIRAKELSLPTLIYTEALGFLSELSFSVGISGIHGKTTTTAITGTIIKELGLEASTLVGSGVPSFGGSAINVNGNNYFIAETCEYYRHFLSFSPNIVLVTSIEMDHPDYFKDYNDIIDAFTSYILKLPEGGEVIYCADDNGVMDLITSCKELRGDIKYTGYGSRAEGDFKLVKHSSSSGLNSFYLKGFNEEFRLKVPGYHTVLDSIGGICIASSLLKEEGIDPLDRVSDIQKGLLKFSGTKRRSEIIGERDGILFIDDYGHHPTAINTTLKGYRDFYPGRRIIVDFMSHTYTRTSELLDEFASSFSSADIVILNKIYSSARELYNGKIDGETLFNETKKYHDSVYYCPEYEDAIIKVKSILKPGDIFVTMGAGNNWQVGERVFKEV
ncbi:UDP-N-acetylmuramate--L-alanine ligase [Thiospirochaeta perfilievii]|uniref:UDP-N-acetylmuramate--L-alanine ligase n=1 Tax=Thiospirochaeta perfilievii TaxID=252967 RepID=A0A5C1QEW3_9SPIO|nr:UDP-N-acetylmuramate--L-alanine ligase [Thiospirochaeta perfilievii]QEN05937.1 UDP-N-acetylmuramate--L-alanine ligase [Thiospirochaeta perfilievii]